MEYKITLKGLFNYDNTLFDNLIVDDCIDKDTLIITILEECGEFPLLYPNSSYMKLAFKVFTKKYAWNLRHLIKLIKYEYEPLHNFDRYEEQRDKTKSNAKSETNARNDSYYSAFNDMEYMNYTDLDKTYIKKGTPNMNPTDSAMQTSKGESKGDTENAHSGHLYGNIGVTTSQQMFREEKNIIEEFNAYKEIARLISQDYCIGTY